MLFVVALFGAAYLYYTDKSGTIRGRFTKVTRESDPIDFAASQLALAVFVVVLLILATAKFFWWFWGAV